jgi:hypothetical protein
MGKLVEQHIPTLFHGVSRQPDIVRLPGQLEEADNAFLSVVTGGAEKRAGTIHVGALTAIGASDDPFFYSYNRDEDEQYFVFIKSGAISVYAPDGTEKTVTVTENTRTIVEDADATTTGVKGSTLNIAYPSSETQIDLTSTGIAGGTTVIVEGSSTGAFSGEEVTMATITTNTTTTVTIYPYIRARVSVTGTGTFTITGSFKDLTYLISTDAKNGFAAVTIADYTLIANKEVTVGMEDAAVNDGPYEGLVFVREGGALSTYRVYVNGANVGTIQTGNTSIDTQKVGYIADELENDLNTALGASGYTITRNGSCIKISHATVDFDLSATCDGDSGSEIVAIKNSVQRFSFLPSKCFHGFVAKITSDPTDTSGVYWTKFETEDETNDTEGTWSEHVDPYAANTFDADTMPHQLVRNADGTFTFQKATWDDRGAGDEDTVPTPDFVGTHIEDIVFFRDRLGFVFDETVYFSQAGDYFNFWPDKATQVIDSDPFARQASGTSVNVLSYAVPFKKALFLTSDLNQFEVTASQTFTERNASLEPSTNYKASRVCRPVVVGDSLFFSADAGNSGVVFEYFVDDDTISETAADVTKHVGGYVPSNITQFAGDSVTGTLTALTSGERNAIYVYRFYFDGDKKAQSAWSKWTLGDDSTAATILGVSFIDSYLYIAVRRNGSVFLEKLLVSDEFGDEPAAYTITAPSGTIWPVRLDRRHRVTGVYDAANNWTTWTSTYAHNDEAVVVLSDDFASSVGNQLSVTYPTSTTIRANGDYSDFECIIGIPYRFRARLSRQYWREGENDRAITNGRLQIKQFFFDYVNTGYFQVSVTPKARDAKTWTFTGRVLGDENNVIGEVPLVERGTYKVKRIGKSDETTVEIISDEHVPVSITSAVWIGFFNEITRQE